MSNIDNIISRFNTYLPAFILKSKVLRDIFRSLIYESDAINDYIIQLTDELNISTALKSIDKWESLAGISNPDLNINDRRDMVINKFMGQVHANYYNFIKLLKIYDDTTTIKEIIDEYRIIITTHKNMEYKDLINYLNIIVGYKPAHIGYNLNILRDIFTTTSIASVANLSKCNNLIVTPDVDSNLYSKVYSNLVVNISRVNDVSISPIVDIDLYNNIYSNVVTTTSKTNNILITPNVNNNLYIKSYSNITIGVNTTNNIHINVISDTPQGSFFMGLSIISKHCKTVIIDNSKSIVNHKTYSNITIDKRSVRRCRIE